ncbi:MAG: (Fe-S)-binding protein [Proteobacteria bacterium]|nr:(Fe-S)-binding protein [Pseudomonadota bacterium]
MRERQAAFILLTGVALALFSWTVSRLALVLLRGRPVERPFGAWRARLGDVLRFFFLQLSVARERASWHHLPIFWGFLIITLGTVELLINGVWPAFSLAHVAPRIDAAFKGVLDVTNGAVLAVIGFALWRRLARRRRLIEISGDAALILGMIAGLCLTHFLAHGLHFVAIDGVPPRFQAPPIGPAGYAATMPISAATAAIFSGTDPSTAHGVAAAAYWLHVALVLFFLNYLPYSKHIHLLGALPNILLRNRGQAGVMPQIDLEDPSRWGVGRYEQLSHKSLLDSYACTECARCSNACPAFNTDKPLNPMHLVLDLKDEMQERGELLLRLSTAGWEALKTGALDDAMPLLPQGDRELLATLQALPPLVGGRIKDETLWACTTCGACEAECPVFIEHPLKIMQMRTHLVLDQGRQPPELARMFRGLEHNQNPWGIGSDQRMDWAAGLDVPVLADTGPAEYLLWIGCAGAYDDRGQKIARALVALLQQAGVDFAVLGAEEGCTGDAARRAGNELLFQTLAESNLERLRHYDVKKILTSCPHCYHSFKHEYPQLGGNFEVWHHSQFLARLVGEGRLQPTTKLSEPLVFHDPCYLGRWNHECEAPRQLLAQTSSAGTPPGELPRHRDKSFCCGAGGARMWVEESAPRVNLERSREAVASGATVVATACPFCNVMLGDGMKELNRDDQVEVLDIAQLLARSTGAQPRPAADPST